MRLRLPLPGESAMSDSSGIQLSEEQNQALCVNGKGFNKVDAPILTPQFYLENQFLYRSDLETVSRLIRKYHAQWGE